MIAEPSRISFGSESEAVRGIAVGEDRTSMPRHWDHLADELHRLGYSYIFSCSLVRGRLTWLVDAHDAKHDFRVRAASRFEAFERILTRVRGL